MTTFVWPVESITTVVAGVATEATQLDIKTSVQLIDDTVLTNIHTAQKEIATIQKGHICTANSTNVPLAGNATFTGIFQDILDYNSITIAVASSHASATNGLLIEWSADGLTAMDTDSFNILANAPKTFTFGGYARYFRVSYTNGATLQTSFTLQSIIRTSYGKHSSHRITDTITGQDDATLNKSVLVAKAPTGGFVNLGATAAGEINTVQSNALIPVAHDYISYTSGASNDVYVYKTGGAGGTTVATLTITYTDTSKAVIASIART